MNDMTPTSPAANSGEWVEDGQGRRVPVERVTEYERAEDALVRELFGKAIGLHRQLVAFKSQSFDDLDALVSLLSEKYGRKRGGKKGNVTFSTYDARLKVSINVADVLTFGPSLQIAKEICDEILTDLSKNTPPLIRDLIQDAFRTGKAGQVPRDQIFRLLRTEHDDPRWSQMQGAIKDAIRTETTKSYIRFQFRPNAHASHITLTLDIAAVPLAGDERTQWAEIAAANNLPGGAS